MTDPERTEAEIVKELYRLVRHCWIHSGHANCGYRSMDAEQRALYDQIIHAEPDASAFDTLAALRALPLPAETEHQCSVACVDELQELCDSESDRANVNATTIHDLRLTLRELAGIVERSRKLLDTLCGSVESVEKADQLCEEIATFSASHPELFNTGNAGEGEQPDGN
jgi:hypothetical protein